jgi:hypothetical protein
MVTQEQLAQAILDLKSNLETSYLRLEASQEKTDEQMKKTDERLNKVAKLVGNISNNQGDIAEEFFYNSLESEPSLAGINYDFIDKNITRSRKGIRDEFDIVLVNGKDIAILEVKYKAHLKDIEKLVNKKYTNFKKLYPEYKDYNHHLGLASFNMNEDVKEIALQNNVILLQRKGELVETIVPSR